MNDLDVDSLLLTFSPTFFEDLPLVVGVFQQGRPFRFPYQHLLLIILCSISIIWSMCAHKVTIVAVHHITLEKVLN